MAERVFGAFMADSAAPLFIKAPNIYRFCKIIIAWYGIKCNPYTGIFIEESFVIFRYFPTRFGNEKPTGRYRKNAFGLNPNLRRSLSSECFLIVSSSYSASTSSAESPVISAMSAVGIFFAFMLFAISCCFCAAPIASPSLRPFFSPAASPSSYP